MGHVVCLSELTVLKETIEKGTEWQLIYRYPQETNKFLWNWRDDWRNVLDSFPAAEKDVLSAVDLWALGHSTASVFHSMRVLEHWLRLLARDVGRNFDIQNWQNIIDQIESKI